MTSKDKIQAIFHHTREDRNASFEEKDFIQFLIKPNGKSIDDSFKGKRYKNKFIGEIQMEFAICFPNDFFERKWNFADFVVYVEKRIRQPAVNLKMAEKKFTQSRRSDLHIFVFLNVFFVPPAALFQTPYNLVYLLFPLVLNALFLRLKLKDVNYCKSLVKRIATQSSIQESLKGVTP
jgi:hypothetical protein